MTEDNQLKTAQEDNISLMKQNKKLSDALIHLEKLSSRQWMALKRLKDRANAQDSVDSAYITQIVDESLQYEESDESVQELVRALEEISTFRKALDKAVEEGAINYSAGVGVMVNTAQFALNKWKEKHPV